MKTRATIAVLISGRGSNMAALINACANPDFPVQISQVISDKAHAPGLEIAARAGIQTTTFVRRDYNSKAAHEAAILAQLALTPPHLICLAGYMRIFVSGFRGKLPG